MKDLIKLPYYILLHPPTQLIGLFRIYSFLDKSLVTKPVAYILYYITRIVFSSDIHPKAKIGKNFSIQHHFGIVIGKNVIIKNNVTIFNGVTIGRRNISNPDMPTIGSNTVIYKGVTIVGGGEINNDSIISAHQFIKL